MEQTAERKRTKAAIAWFSIYCIVASALIILSALFASPAYPAHQGKSQPFNQGWTVYEDGMKIADQASLPLPIQNKNCSVIDLYNVLPDTGFHQEVLSTTVFQRGIRVFIEDELVFQDTGGVLDGPGKTPGSGRFYIELPMDVHGKEIHIQFTRAVLSDQSATARIELQDSFFDPYLAIPQGNLLFFVVIALLFLGLLLLILALLLRGLRVNLTAVYFLAAFLISSAVWAMCNTKVIQFFTNNLVLVHTLEYMSFYLIPISLWGFLRLNWKSESRLVSWALWVMSGFYFVAVTCKLLGICDLFALLRIFHFLLLFNVGVFVITAIMAFRSGNLSVRLFYAGFIVLCAGGVTDLVRFYIGVSSETVATYFVTGVLALGVCIIVIFMVSIKDVMTAQIREDVYKKLAYTDPLTQINNRLMFDEDIAAFQKKAGAGNNWVLANIDVDKFKGVNDTYGHLAGDDVLRLVSERLTSAFTPEGKCYRIGGDEFVVIAVGITVEQMNERLEQMNQGLVNNRLDIPVTISYGAVDCEAAHYEDVYDVLKIADAIMYQNKRSRLKGVEENEIL